MEPSDQALPPELIASRARAIRLNFKDLATLAKVSETHTGATLAGKHSPRLTTLLKLSRALVAEEQRLLVYLEQVHGRRMAA